MRTPLKLAAFGGVLAVAFAGAFGVGSAVGDPRGEAPPGHDMQDAEDSTGNVSGSRPGAEHDDIARTAELTVRAEGAGSAVTAVTAVTVPKETP